MPTTLTYQDIQKNANTNVPVTGNGEGGVFGGQLSGTFSGTVTIDIPQVPPIDFPLTNLEYDQNISVTTQNVDEILNLKSGFIGGKKNDYAGSQVLINSDRVILNSRTDYLMLFGKEGVAISSPGNVNIDADEAVTIYGEDGVFIGVPGKGTTPPKKEKPKELYEARPDNEYEPIVLGLRLANWLEDLIISLKNAKIVALGGAAFREDTCHDFASLHSRIRDMLSTYAFVDGVSHEPVDEPPAKVTQITEMPKQLTGTVTGTMSGFVDGTIGNTAPSTEVTDPLKDVPDFFEATDELF